MSFEWQLQTVSENDKDPSANVVDKPAPIDESGFWVRVLNVKNAAGQKSIALLAKWCELASHYHTETQMLKLERWFSINKKVVTPDRASLGQDTVSAIRLVKEVIRIHSDGQVSGIPVTHWMLQPARSAYYTYAYIAWFEASKPEADKTKQFIKGSRSPTGWCQEEVVGSNKSRWYVPGVSGFGVAWSRKKESCCSKQRTDEYTGQWQSEEYEDRRYLTVTH